MSERDNVLSRRQMLGFGAVAPLSGFVGPGRKSASRNRPRYRDEKLYHGPMRLPTRILEMAAGARLVKTSANHKVLRISDDGLIYLLRTYGGPTHDQYLGEIVRGERDGRIRVHVWAIIDCPDARPLADLVAYHADGRDVYAEREAKSEQLDQMTDINSGE